MAFVHQNDSHVLSELKYTVVEWLYRLLGYFVLRREQFTIVCPCGYARGNLDFPSYAGALITEKGFWKEFKPTCPYCEAGSGRVIATRTGRELGGALHRLWGYTEHANQSLHLKQF